MNKILIVIRKEYLERVQSKGFLISTILIPLFMGSFILIPIGIELLNRDSQSTIAFYDATGRYRESIESTFNTQKTLSILWVDWQSESERAATLQGIESGKISGYVLITDKDEKLQAIYTSKNVTDFSLNRSLENAIQKSITRLTLKTKGFTDTDIAQIEKPVTLVTQKLSGEKESGALSQFLLTYVMVLLIYGTLLTYGITVMSSVMEEKASKVMEVLVASVKPFDLMVGKVIGVGLVAITQYIIWVVVLLGLSLTSLQYAQKFQFDLPPLLLLYFVVYFVFGYLIFATLYAAIGSAFENAQDAQSLQTPITLLIIIPILALSYVISKPDSTLSVVLSLFPFFSPILMMARLSITDVPLWQTGLSFVLMILTFYVVMQIAAKIYRVGVLMYGKKPSFSEIMKWMKYA